MNWNAGFFQKILSPVLVLSLLPGICLHLAFFGGIRIASSPIETHSKTPGFIQFVSPDPGLSGNELEEQATLLDSAPLFIPGRWNAAYNIVPPQPDSELKNFPLYEPEMDVATNLLPEGRFIGSDYVVNEAIDLLALTFRDVFYGFGIRGLEAVDLGGSAVFAEIRSLDGRVLHTQSTGIERFSSQTVQPGKYFLQVETGGRLAAPPTISESSGDAEFDAAVYDWLTQSGLISVLEPGYFEAIVYP